MLWHVRIPLRQKLILIGIFSVTVVVIIIAIIRVAIINPVNGYIDISWLYVWSSVEVSTCMHLSPTLFSAFFNTYILTTLSEVTDDGLDTAIVIACVSSFRQLFVTDQNQHQYRRPGQSSSIITHRGLLHFFRSLKRKFTSSASSSNIEPASIPSNRNQSSWHRLNSKTQILPLDGIHISQDNSISSRTLK